jgi:hypothetical protein
MASQNIRSSIAAFKANSNFDYARPNLFQVDIDFPQAVALAANGTNKPPAAGSPPPPKGGSQPAAAAPVGSDAINILGSYLIKAAQIPASTVGVIEVPFRGRMLKIAGDRTFEPWTITIHNDTAFRLRSWFEKWMECIQLYDENATMIDHGTGVTGTPSYLNYMKNMRVTQLDRRGNAVRSYEFYDCWPSNVSSIDLDFGSNDAIEEFTVEFQVQYWKPIAGDIKNEVTSITALSETVSSDTTASGTKATP